MLLLHIDLHFPLPALPCLPTLRTPSCFPILAPATLSICHLSFHAVDVGVHGPISQSKLLGGLGINLRVEALLQNASEEQAVALRSAYWRLVGDGEPPWEDEEEDEASSSRESDAHAQGPQKLEGMGLKYKALAITSRQMGCPVAFE